MPELTNRLRDFVPEEHLTVCISAWLIFALGFILYTRVSAKCDAWLAAFVGLVVYIWSSIAERLPSRIMIKHLAEDNGFVLSEWIDESLWVGVPFVLIVSICYSRYKKDNSLKNILA